MKVSESLNNTAATLTISSALLEVVRWLWCEVWSLQQGFQDEIECNSGRWSFPDSTPQPDPHKVFRAAPPPCALENLHLAGQRARISGRRLRGGGETDTGLEAAWWGDCKDWLPAHGSLTSLACPKPSGLKDRHLTGLTAALALFWCAWESLRIWLENRFWFSRYEVGPGTLHF